MKNTFLDKIKMERKVLKVINQASSSGAMLHGLSKPAIESWKKRSNLSNVHEITNLLLEISTKCSLLSHRSGELRPEATPEKFAEIENEIKKLRRLISTN